MGIRSREDHEYLSKISVTFNTVKIRHIKLETNKGEVIEKGFKLSGFQSGEISGTESQPIVGFYGNESTDQINSIGVLAIKVDADASCIPDYWTNYDPNATNDSEGDDDVLTMKQRADIAVLAVCICICFSCCTVCIVIGI